MRPSSLNPMALTGMGLTLTMLVASGLMNINEQVHNLYISEHVSFAVFFNCTDFLYF